MIINLFLSLLFSVHAGQTHDLAGIWTSSEPKIELQLKGQDLQIIQCSESNQTGCFHFQYKIINEQIFLNSRKVGDLFPFHLLIYDSNTQMTEMHKIKLINQNQVEYTYSYTNMDGAALFLKSELKKSTN